MKLIQEWLGHSDISTTSNIYTHVDSESKKLSADAIAKALGRIKKGPLQPQQRKRAWHRPER